MEAKKSTVLAYHNSYSGWGQNGPSRGSNTSRSGSSQYGSKETVFQHLTTYTNQRVILRLAGGRKGIKQTAVYIFILIYEDIHLF